MFCNKCGASVTTGDQVADKSDKTDSQPVGERKHATVLFSDLLGYTAMAERLDSEEVKNLMAEIFEKARAEIN